MKIIENCDPEPKTQQIISKKTKEQYNKLIFNFLGLEVELQRQMSKKKKYKDMLKEQVHRFFNIVFLS